MEKRELLSQQTPSANANARTTSQSNAATMVEMPSSSQQHHDEPIHTTQIEFVRVTSAIDGTSISGATARNSSQDYVARRMALWDSPAPEDPIAQQQADIVLGAICSLPVPLQVAFRRKMLSIFAIQLLFITAVVSICAYAPSLNRQIESTFANPYWALLPFFIMVLLLLMLYFVRNRFPWNWFVLLCFSLCQSVFFASLGVAFKTNIGVFNCAFTFFCVCIMIMLSGLRRRSRDDPEGHLLSSFAAGMIGYVVVALVSCILFANYGRSFVTDQGFGLTLLFQLALMIWFSLDASSMYRVMSPDEYMQGVIYFYTDFILLVVICCIVAGFVVVCGLVVGSSGAGGASCDGCVVCYNGPCDCCCGGRNPEEEEEGQQQHDAAHHVVEMDRV